MSGLTACTVYEYALSASLLGDARVHQSMAAMEPHAPMLEHTHAPTDIRACEHSHAHRSARLSGTLRPRRDETLCRRYSVGSEAGGYSEWFSFAQPPQAATDTCAR
jgi:hypothetical protein